MLACAYQGKKEGKEEDGSLGWWGIDVGSDLR